MKRYMLEYYENCKPYYDGNSDKLIDFGFNHRKYFDDIFEARRFVNNLPNNCTNVVIWEVFEEYKDDFKIVNEKDF